MCKKQENYLDAIETLFNAISMFDDFNEPGEANRYESIVGFQQYISEIAAKQFMYGGSGERESDLFRIVYDFMDYLKTIEGHFQEENQKLSPK
jgi:hypothetical protein